MALLGMNFDATQVAPQESFAAIPSGDYPAQILKTEMRATKDGNGQYLWLEHEIIDGDFKGRLLWNNLNLVNASAEAVQIARRQLSAICHAIGEMNVTDSEQLHFKPFIVSVKLKPAGFREKNGYVTTDAKNEIGGYKAASGPGVQVRSAPQTQAPQASRPAAQTAPAAQPAKQAPWSRARA
jgi:hypothetical protein